ncbi:MAG TPA: acyltransferase family protein, partial [Roseiflexaceae bacterium]|nr:acyltransferase family protein [Roseiflexaceae bacterium]
MTVSELTRPALKPARVAAATARLAFVDNLRTFLAALVVAHHAGQAYGPTGGDWPIFNPTRAALLGPFFGVNASFFMGLFFLIAGYFVPMAYDRRGAGGFLRERILRLGLPLLVVSLGLFLPLAYTSQDQPLMPFLASYLRTPEVGHMWFAGHLIVYAFAYCVWRLFADRPGVMPVAPALPRHRDILWYVFGLTLATFVVRLVFPIDRWVVLAPFIRAEPAHLPQYASLFVLGIVAYRGDWLTRFPTAMGMTWLKIGLAAATLPYATTVLRELTLIDIRLF